MKERILYVEDDTDTTAAFRTLYRRSYEIVTTGSGMEGMRVIRKQKPFAVIISDMRMPGMDGIRFLQEAEYMSPESVRIMLTGAKDQKTAMDAVNEGHIFRFLVKPCPQERMMRTLADASEHYRLLIVERDLLENTLRESINVLVEALALSNPAAFRRTRRLQILADRLLDLIRPAKRWQYEVAVTLSQIGCLTIPESILEKDVNSLKLTPGEETVYYEHPRHGRKLIERIPRLERVAEIIALQMDPYKNLRSHEMNNAVRLGASLLRVVTDYDRLIQHGLPPKNAVSKMSHQPELYNEDLLRCLRQIDTPRPASSSQLINISDLENDMIIAKKVCTAKGLLVVPEGYKINDAVRARLKNFANGGLIEQTVRIEIDDQ